LDELQNHIPEDFSIVELRARIDERNPYAVVALQEAERMNNLFREIRQSLKELDGGLKVCLIDLVYRRLIQIDYLG
jgi:dynein heavy chain